jgi:hypothetical protein
MIMGPVLNACACGREREGVDFRLHPGLETAWEQRLGI